MPTGTKCSVSDCKNSYKKTRHDKNMRYHPLPKDEELRKIWIQFCQKDDKWNPQIAYICSKHFREEDFMRDLKAELLGLPPKRHVKPTAVPSLYLTSEEQSHSVSQGKTFIEEKRETLQESTSLTLISQDCHLGQTADVGIQTDTYRENYNELLKRIGNLEEIIEQYKDIVQEYQIKNELLENSIREAATIKEQDKPLVKQKNKMSTKRTSKVCTQSQPEIAVKKKKLLWNAKEKFNNCRLKYLCKGCYIISS